MTTSTSGAPAALDSAMRRHQAGDLATARGLYREHLSHVPDDVPAYPEYFEIKKHWPPESLERLRALA